MSPTFLPDPLRDSTRRRRRKAGARAGDGVRGILPRLHRAAGPDLVMVTLALWHADGAALYLPSTGAAARRAVLEALPGQACWCKLERSRSGLLHVHALTGAALPHLPPGAHVRPIHDAPGLLAYLSKPSDARATWHWEEGRKVRPTAADLHAAATDLAAARMRGRLPRLSWTAALPR